MSQLYSVLRRELDLLSRQRIGLILILLMPAALLAIFGREGAVRPVRILVAGVPGVEGVKPDVDRLLLILRESSALTVATEAQAVFDPVERLANGPYDLVLNYEGDEGKELSIYTAETDPLRMERLERVGAGILRASAVIASRREAGKHWKPLFGEVAWSQPALYEDLFMLGTFPVNPLFEYFPQAADPRLSGLPSFLSVVLILLPLLFVTVRARESEPPAVVESWGDAVAIALGRSLAACTITLASFFLLLIVMESSFGVLVKAGFLGMIAVLLPSMLASAFLGLWFPKLIRSPLGVVASCLGFSLLILLSGGLWNPPADDSWPAQLASSFLPTTFLRPVLGRWIFGAFQYDGATLDALGWLGLQCLVYGAIAVFALRRPEISAKSPAVVVSGKVSGEVATLEA